MCATDVPRDPHPCRDMWPVKPRRSRPRPLPRHVYIRAARAEPLRWWLLSISDNAAFLCRERPVMESKQMIARLEERRSDTTWHARRWTLSLMKSIRMVRGGSSSRNARRRSRRKRQALTALKMGDVDAMIRDMGAATGRRPRRGRSARTCYDIALAKRRVACGRREVMHCTQKPGTGAAATDDEGSKHQHRGQRSKVCRSRHGVDVFR